MLSSKLPSKIEKYIYIHINVYICIYIIYINFTTTNHEAPLQACLALTALLSMCAPKQPLMFQEFPTRSPSFGNSPSPSRSTWHKCNVGQGGSQLCNDYILLRTSRGESCSRQVQHTAGSAASLSVSPSAFFSTLPSPSKSTASCIDCPETNKL